MTVVTHDLDAERGVLGTLLLSERAMYALVLDEGLQPDHFYSPAHRHVYAAMRGLFDEGKPFDRITVRAWLRDRGLFEHVGEDAMAWLAGEPVNASRAREYARIVRGTARLRAADLLVDETKRKIREGATDGEVLADLERGVLNIAHDERTKAGRWIPDILADEIEAIVKRSENDEIAGIKTGFEQVDKLTGGLSRGSLTIIAARPAMGKSAFELNVAEQIAEGGLGVVLFSMEMSEAELAQRMLARRARVPLDVIRAGTAKRHHLEKLVKGAAGMDHARLHIDDTPGLTISALRAKARMLAAQSQIDVIIVDYLQLMPSSPGADNRVQGIGEISMGLKILARELDVAVIALSQLSRKLEDRVDKRPVLSDLRDSGQIEQDADNVWFINRPHYWDEKADELLAEQIIAKARQGKLGTIKHDFLGEYQHFRERALEVSTSTYAGYVASTGGAG